MARCLLVLGGLCLCLCLVTPTAAWAQLASQTGLIGTVRDAGGSVVPGVTVTAVNVGTRDTYETTTNEEGIYNVPNVAVGRYVITIALDGFKTYQASGVEVAGNQVVRRDAVLEVGALTETVTVEGASTTLSTDRAAISQTIDTRAVSDCRLPAATCGRSRAPLPASSPARRATSATASAAPVSAISRTT